MRRLLPFASVLALACVPPYPRITLDGSSNCNRVDIEVERAAVQGPDRPWGRVFAAAHDGAGSRGAWLLVEQFDAGTPRLALVHEDGDELDAQVDLELPAGLGRSLTLRPGSTPGDAWLVRGNVESFQLWHVSASRPQPLVATSLDLVGFPYGIRRCDVNLDGDYSDECDVSGWWRELAFIGGVPHVVVVPDRSHDAATILYVGTLADNLAIQRTSSVVFEPQCGAAEPTDDFAQCEAEKGRLSYPAFEPLGSQLDPRGSAHALAFLRYVQLDNIPEPYPELTIVWLVLGEDQIPLGFLGSLEDDLRGFQPVPGPPSGLAIDDFYAYVAHASASGEPRLLRTPLLDVVFEDLDFDLPAEFELLQLDRDLATARIDDGRLVIDKPFPDAPEQSRRTVYDGPAPIEAFRPAGVGALLVHYEDDTADVVRVACTAPDPS